MITKFLKTILRALNVVFAPILRFLSAIFILGAVIALTTDFSRPEGIGTFLSLHQHLSDFAPKTLLAMKLNAPDAGFSKVLLRTYLNLPAFLSMGITGLTLAWLGRRRREVQIYMN